MKPIVTRDMVASLNPRHVEVLRSAANGLGVKATANKCGLGAETVKTHRRNAMRAIGAKNIAQACVMAQKAGVL